MVGNVLTERLPHIGFVYITMAADDHPAEYFGGGTWEKIEGKFLLAASDAYPVESTGGEAEHKLTIAEMPSHTHGFTNGVNVMGSTSHSFASGNGQWAPSGTVLRTDIIKTGGDQSHNNLPPYVAAFMYRRIA